MKNLSKTGENYHATGNRRRKRDCVGQLVYHKVKHYLKIFINQSTLHHIIEIRSYCITIFVH